MHTLLRVRKSWLLAQTFITKAYWRSRTLCRQSASLVDRIPCKIVSSTAGGY